MELDEEIAAEGTGNVRSSQSGAVRQRVAALILARADEEVSSLVVRRAELPDPWQGILDYLRAVFHALGPLAKEDESSRAASLLQEMYGSVVGLRHWDGPAVDKRLVDCVAFLIQELDGLPRPRLSWVCGAVVSGLERAGHLEGASVHHLLEFLPRCLPSIAGAGLVHAPGGDGVAPRTTGLQFRDNVLQRLLAIRWSKRLVTSMASLLRDLPLEMAEMERFVRKLFFHMKDADPQDLPSLVYQLLVLASKGFKRIVLTGLIDFFNKKHGKESTQNARASSIHAPRLKAAMDAFREVEGTVVLHINFAVKQDSALGQECLSLVRTNSWPLTPFLVSILLSIGRIQRFEKPVFDFLRAEAVKCFKDCQQCRESRWAAAILGDSAVQTATKAEDSFMRTVRTSAFGWDHIIPSVVRMGFCLIESVGPGRPRLDDSMRPSERESDVQELGIRVLSAAFEVHEMARDEIIEQCKCRIMGLKPQHSAPILRMIVQLVQSCPRLMLGHAARLKECLDYFTFLPPSAASSLVQAITPLFQLSQDLQDYTVLVLRKAMFGREESARMTAVRGLLNLLILEKRSRASDSEAARGRLSEASSSQGSSQFERNSGRPGSLLQDLLGLLRRCLSQQASVRETLYRCLPELLVADSDASEAVFDLIWPHFSRYYFCDSDNSASLKLDSCVVVNNQAVRVVEPLDHLFSCVHRLLVHRPHWVPESAFSWTDFGFSQSQGRRQELARCSSGESLAKAFHNIRKTLKLSESAGLYKDKIRHASSDSLEGEKCLELVRLLLGVVEVILDSAVLDCVSRDSEARQSDVEMELHTLLDLHDSLVLMVGQKQGKCVGTGSEKRPPKTTGPEKPRKRVKAPLKASQSNQPLEKAAALSVARMPFVDKRDSFLSCAGIVYLLDTYVSRLRSRPAAEGTAQGEDGIVKEMKMCTFALRNCLRLLKAVASEGVPQMDCSRAIDRDWQLLARPLFHAIVALMNSSANDVPGGEDAERESRKRTRRKVETELGDELLAVKCLEELIRVAIQRKCLIEVVRQMGLDEEGNMKDESGHESDEELMSNGETEEMVFGGSEARILHCWLTAQVRPLLERLLTRSVYPEIEVLCGVMQNLGSKLPQVLMKKHGLWAKQSCAGLKVHDSGAARSLISMAICLSPPPEDISVTEVFAAELIKVTGSDTMEPIERSSRFPMINKHSHPAIGGFLAQKAEGVVADLEWLVGKLKVHVSSEIAQMDRKAGGSQRTQMEEALHSRMEKLVSVLSMFTSMTLYGALAEQILKVTSRFYRCLSAATRLLIAPKGFTQPLPSPLFQKMTELTCKKLTMSVYNFISSKQRDHQEGAGKGKESVSQIKREGRTIPNLIFHIEASERYLLQLSKTSKVNLLRLAKRSTARDFRINGMEKKRKKAAADEQGGEKDGEESEENPEAEAADGGAEEPEEEGEGEGEGGEEEEEEEVEEDDNQDIGEKQQVEAGDQGDVNGGEEDGTNDPSGHQPRSSVSRVCLDSDED